MIYESTRRIDYLEVFLVPVLAKCKIYLSSYLPANLSSSDLTIIMPILRHYNKASLAGQVHLHSFRLVSMVASEKPSYNPSIHTSASAIKPPIIPRIIHENKCRGKLQNNDIFIYIIKVKKM